MAERRKTEKTQQAETELTNPLEWPQPEQTIERSEEVNKPSDSGCTYYFGYLAERDKGVEIPAGCLECPKSIDCMLNNYKSKESVTEIKKWYHR